MAPCNENGYTSTYLVAVRIRPWHVGPVEDVPSEGSPALPAVAPVAAGLVEVGVRGAADAGVVYEDAPAKAKQRENAELV